MKKVIKPKIFKRKETKNYLHKFVCGKLLFFFLIGVCVFSLFNNNNKVKTKLPLVSKNIYERKYGKVQFAFC